MAAGWDIATAIAKTAPVQNLDWERQSTERRLYVLNSRPDAFQFDERQLSREENLRLRRNHANRDHTNARAKTHDEFRKIMATGRLVAWGYLNGITGERGHIEPSRWRGLTNIGEGNSAATDHLGKTGFVGITVYPALEAPNAEATIVGRSIADILRDFVLSDPEIEALHDGADDARSIGLCDIIGSAGDGGCLVPISDSRNDIGRALSTFLPLQDEAGKLTALGEAIASRLAALGKLLIDGNLVAHGINHGDKNETSLAVPKGGIERPSTRLCLRSGDIWREQGDDKQRLFSAVRLKLPQASDNAAAPNNPGDTENTGGAPMAAHWVAALDIVLSSIMKREIQPTSAADLAREMVAAIGNSDEAVLAKKLNRENKKMPGNAKTGVPKPRRISASLESAGQWLADNFPKFREAVKKPPTNQRS